MGSIETFMWGFFGGVGAELAVLFSVRQQFPDRFPHWISSGAYYFIAILMAIVGGVIAAYVRSGTSLSAILAIQVGASAPLFFRKAREAVAEPPEVPDINRID